MEKCNRNIIRFCIALISVCFIDGGRSLLLVSNNIEIIINHSHSNDFEVPHQHHNISCNTEEKWLESFRFDFWYSSYNPVLIPFSFNKPNQDFVESIWQPPKFV